MSFMTETSQTKAASATAKWQSELAGQLSEIAIPELQAMMGPGGQISSLLASTQGGKVKSTLDEQAYQAALGTLNQAYGQQGRISSEAIGYQGLRTGEGRRSPGAMTSAIGQAATALDKDRMAALRNLEFASAASSMTDYNKLLQLMGQGTQTGLQLAQGFAGIGTQGIGGLSNWSNANTASAAASGAATIYTILGAAGAL